MSYLLQVTLDVREQPDGSLLATSTDLPIYLIAANQEELRNRIRELHCAIEGYFRRVSPGEAAEFLKERGASFEPVSNEIEDVDGQVRVPMLVGV